MKGKMAGQFKLPNSLKGNDAGQANESKLDSYDYSQQNATEYDSKRAT